MQSAHFFFFSWMVSESTEPTSKSMLRGMHGTCPQDPEGCLLPCSMRDPACQAKGCIACVQSRLGTVV
jgi:uncharacterized protein (DUF983 family)